MVTGINGVGAFDTLGADEELTEGWVDILGSEEYKEWVGADFNDAFAFFLNGENIALLPHDETTMVSINNVNDGNNSQYYIDNDFNSDGTPGSPSQYQIIEADGFTTKLKAEGTPETGVSFMCFLNERYQLFGIPTQADKFVLCDPYLQWNTIKLSLADVADSEYDSWVLLEASSFTCVDPEVSEAPSVSSAPSVSTQPSSLPSSKPSVSSSPR